jgi:tight adherence protein B
MTLVYLLPLGVGGLLLVVGFVMSRRSQSSLIEERLGLAQEPVDVEAADKKRKSPVGEAVTRALAQRGLGAGLSTQLAQADLKLTVGEFLAATVIIILAGAAIAYLLSKSVVTVGLVVIGGFFLPRVYLAQVRKQRLKSFNDQLGDALNLLVNSLRAGYSVLQAMESIAHEMGPPISVEFGRVHQEVQLGLTMEDALAHMVRRIRSEDLDMTVTAINVQREVGGNLAEVLDSISHTIRERVRIQGEIRALTSYGRGAGTLLSALPVVLSGLIYLIQPEFMVDLFSHTCGYIMVAVAVAGIVLGYVVIRKIVDIDV